MITVSAKRDLSEYVLSFVSHFVEFSLHFFPGELSAIFLGFLSTLLLFFLLLLLSFLVDFRDSNLGRAFELM